jgi:hypothetical protein
MRRGWGIIVVNVLECDVLNVCKRMSIRSIVGKLLGSFYWRQVAAERCRVRRGGKSIKKIVMIGRCFVGFSEESKS